MRINFILAAFNMIPGFPLDGGRVLRAIVWWFTKNFQRATQVAALSGQVVAFGFIAVGVFTIFQGRFMDGLWLAFIGWFLQNAAASSYAQTTMRNALRGVKVSQVMNRDCTRVPSLISINQLVEDRVLTGGQRCFFVADDGRLEGMLTLKDIAAIPKPKWRFTTTRQAMVPLDRLVHVSPDTELMDALQTMDKSDVAQVPVVKAGELVGTLSRDQVLHYLRLRAELGI
jgi:CBS domain-containing protein